VVQTSLDAHRHKIHQSFFLVKFFSNHLSTASIPSYALVIGNLASQIAHLHLWLHLPEICASRKAIIASSVRFPKGSFANGQSLKGNHYEFPATIEEFRFASQAAN